MNVLLAEDPLCPNSATFFGFMGVTAALVFCSKWSTPLPGALHISCNGPRCTARQ